MIILMHAEKWVDPEEAVRAVEAIGGEARIARNTPILFLPDLPEVDAERLPIFAFIVSGGETHYWRGEPIKLPEKK